MMRPVFVTRFRGAAFEDYDITIEEFERSRTIARRKRRVKTSHGLDDIGGIRRSYWRMCLRCGKPSTKRDYAHCDHSLTSVCIVECWLGASGATFINPLDAAAARSELPQLC